MKRHLICLQLRFEASQNVKLQMLSRRTALSGNTSLELPPYLVCVLVSTIKYGCMSRSYLTGSYWCLMRYLLSCSSYLTSLKLHALCNVLSTINEKWYSASIPIGTRVHSIEWRYFNDLVWPLTTPHHPNFVTLTTPLPETVSSPKANTWHSLQPHEIWRLWLQPFRRYLRPWSGDPDHARFKDGLSPTGWDMLW